MSPDAPTSHLESDLLWHALNDLATLSQSKASANLLQRFEIPEGQDLELNCLACEAGLSIHNLCKVEDGQILLLSPDAKEDDGYLRIDKEKVGESAIDLVRECFGYWRDRYVRMRRYAMPWSDIKTAKDLAAALNRHLDELEADAKATLPVSPNVLDAAWSCMLRLHRSMRDTPGLPQPPDAPDWLKSWDTHGELARAIQGRVPEGVTVRVVQEAVGMVLAWCEAAADATNTISFEGHDTKDLNKTTGKVGASKARRKQPRKRERDALWDFMQMDECRGLSDSEIANKFNQRHSRSIAVGNRKKATQGAVKNLRYNRTKRSS